MNNQKHLNGWAGLLLLFLLASSGLSQTNITKETKAMLPKTQALIAGKKPVRVVFYGDSISEVKTGWSGGASKPEQNWGAHLVRLLAKAYPDTTFTEAHFAIGGQNTYEGLGRLDGLEALKPDLVLVAFGANDCGYHFLIPEETQLALATLVTDIRKRFGADVIVVGTGGDNPLKPFFRHLDETLAAQRQAAAETGAPFADIRKAVLGATDNGKRWAEFNINEGNCHPTDKGHEVWAETVMAVVRSVITSAN